MIKIFKVGDVCVGQNLVSNPEFNGMDCEIVGGLEMRSGYVDSFKHPPILMYEVQWACGRRTYAVPHVLRPKSPPRRDIDEVVSWESVGWMPMDVKLDRAIKESLWDQVREKA